MFLLETRLLVIHLFNLMTIQNLLKKIQLKF